MIYINFSGEPDTELMKKKVVIIGGPTASGKSLMALYLAERYPLEIVNFDSLQVFRYMDIGTAKPTPAVRSSYPHHLYDIKDPDEHFSVAQYVAEAWEKTEEILLRGKTPLFVGGTGLYIRSYLLGIDEIPSSTVVRNLLLDRVKQEGLNSLYREVQERDPEFAGEISPNDKVRIIRALEAMLITGMPFSSQRKKWKRREKKFDDLFFVLSPDRDVLYEQINERVDSMIAEGFVDEVKRLLDMGYSSNLLPMRSIGYRHIVAFLKGKESLSRTIEYIKRDTRHYAKRQLTWFKRDVAHWHEPRDKQKISKLVYSFLI